MKRQTSTHVSGSLVTSHLHASLFTLHSSLLTFHPNMGIGRRDFIATFSSVLAGLAALPSAAAATSEDLYLNRRLGFAFRKPSGWFFNNVQEMGQVAKGQLLDLEGPEINSLWDNVTDQLPIVSVSRGAVTADGGDVTPGVNVYLDLVENEDDRDILVCATGETELLEVLLRDWRILSGPSPVKISGCPGAEYFCSFLFEHENLKTPALMRLRTVLLDHDRYRYTLRMYDAPEHKTPQPFDYTELVGSIRLI